MKFLPTETELVGNWVTKNDGSVVGDATTQRIKWLAESCLTHLAYSPSCGAWETLFRDEEDNRLWERTYPQGHMHGGGPPKLYVISLEEACAKYGIEINS